MYALNELWSGSITPSERGYREGSHYAELTKQASESEELFYRELSPSGKKAFDQYYNLHLQLSDISERDSFIRGYRLGARMLLDVIGQYDAPMVQVNELLKSGSS